MKLDNLVPTNTFVVVGGVPARVWQAETEAGEVATLLVMRVVLTGPDGHRRYLKLNPGPLEIVPGDGFMAVV